MFNSGTKRERENACVRLKNPEMDLLNENVSASVNMAEKLLPENGKSFAFKMNILMLNLLLNLLRKLREYNLALKTSIMIIIHR